MKKRPKTIAIAIFLLAALIPTSAGATIQQFQSVISQIGTVKVKALQGFQKAIDVNLPASITSKIGNVNFSCPIGATAHNCLPINSFGGLANLTPQTLGQLQGQIPTKLGAVGNGIIKDMQIAQFRALYPQTALQIFRNSGIATLDSNLRMGQIPKLDLGQIPVSPEILNKKFSEYANAGVKVTLEKLNYNPNLNEALDLDKYPINPADAVRLNTVLKSEIPLANAIILTGTNLHPGVRCTGPCDLIETSEGKILYSADQGETRCVKGGLGFAAGWTCEPAGVTLGRHFDLTFSIHDIDPQKGQFRMQANQNICWYPPFMGKTCLAHVIPVPIPIYVQVDKGNPYYPGIYVSQ